MRLIGSENSSQLMLFSTVFLLLLSCLWIILADLMLTSFFSFLFCSSTNPRLPLRLCLQYLKCPSSPSFEGFEVNLKISLSISKKFLQSNGRNPNVRTIFPFFLQHIPFKAREKLTYGWHYRDAVYTGGIKGVFFSSSQWIWYFSFPFQSQSFVLFLAPSATINSFIFSLKPKSRIGKICCTTLYLSL